MNKKTLATYYYLDHFREMLRFNLDVNGDLLTPSHIDFIGRFKVLSQDAQCLYIRMANRKQYIFEQSSIDYEEIHNKSAAALELASVGMIRQLQINDYENLLTGFTKPQLIDLATRSVWVAVKSSWPKGKILQTLLQQLPYEQAIELIDREQFWVQDQRSVLGYLLFLYFGSSKLDLKQFTLRDLGILRVNDNTDFSARFDDRQEALSCYRVTQIRQLIEFNDIDNPEELMAELLALDDVEAGPMARLKDKALYELGRWFEAHHQLENTLTLLQASNLVVSQKRYIRLQYAADANLAKTYLETLLQQGQGDELFLFAKDFYGRKFDNEKLSLQTSRLREGELIRLDDSYRHAAERGLIDHFTRQGCSAWFTENHLWRSLFALAFWEPLFNDPRSQHSNFDRLPQSLRDKSFVVTYQAEIETIIEQMAKGNGLLPLVKTMTAHYGQPNGLFRWQKFKLEPIQLLLEPTNRKATASILKQMASNYPAMKDGYPDLLISRDQSIRFIEVKADGDQLRQNQLTRLQQLQDAGFECEINRVSYDFNPQQTFVVVDLETTGGKKPYHRVTEIGAIKIQQGQIIDSFETLINPQRPIPAAITQLTGISNAMVTKAPVFADIADSLQNFLDGAVFVAHNVNFDYGFLQMEYERLGRSFRFPKFCTVANTKKLFPGLSSYSLKNLCVEFDIPLDRHHRALDDAKAAAELLRLINEKREQLA